MPACTNKAEACRHCSRVKKQIAATSGLMGSGSSHSAQYFPHGNKLSLPCASCNDKLFVNVESSETRNVHGEMKGALSESETCHFG